MSEKSRGPDSGVLELERYEPGTAVVTYHGVKFGCIEEKNPNKSGLNMCFSNFNEHTVTQGSY